MKTLTEKGNTSQHAQINILWYLQSYYSIEMIN